MTRKSYHLSARWRNNRIAALICWGILACTRVPQSRNEFASTQDSVHQLVGSRVEVATRLAREGLDLDTVLSEVASRAATGLARRADGSQYLFLVQRQGNASLALTSLDDVSAFRPAEVALFPQGRNDHLYFWMVFDDPLENSVGGLLYRIRESARTVVFTDSATTCTPARLQRGPQGEPYVVVFQTELAQGDCTHPCALALRDTFGMTAAWAETFGLDDTVLVRASAGHEAFYRDLAEVYRRMLAWLPANEESLRCPSTMEAHLSAWREEALRRSQ